LILPAGDLPLACMAVVRLKDRQRAMTSDLQSIDELGCRSNGEMVRCCGMSRLCGTVGKEIYFEELTRWFSAVCRCDE